MVAVGNIPGPSPLTRWLDGLFEFGSKGADPHEVRVLCRETGYAHWAGMLNGNGLVEKIPGPQRGGRIRLSPCGLFYLSIFRADKRYGPAWVERAIKNWRRDRLK